MFEQRNTEENVDQPVLCLHQSRGKKESRKSQRTPGYAWLSVFLYLFISFNSIADGHIRKKYEIKGGISPKSVVASGTGLFSAQNMMYRHSITVYDKSGKLLAKIKDDINLNEYGFSQYKSGNYKGAPVEAKFTNDGSYLWVSNYNMIGEGFDRPGCDACSGKGYDPGFLYKINTSTFEIENVVEVGAIPKFLEISQDEKIMIVSNWTSGDVSIIDLEEEIEIKRIHIGPHPRGVAITKDSKKAYVTVMGSTKIAEINLENYEVSYILNIGRSPRHVVLSNDDKLLYIAVNSSNTVVKYDLITGDKQVCHTNSGPRTMVLSPNQKFLYVVNYFSNTFSKIKTDSMKVVEVIKTGNHPIGITANWEDAEIWVACYTGKIEVFKDFELEKMNKEAENDWGMELADFFPYFTMEESQTNQYKINELDNSEEISTKSYSLRPKKHTRHMSSIDSTRVMNIRGEVDIIEVFHEPEAEIVLEENPKEIEVIELIPVDDGPTEIEAVDELEIVENTSHVNELNPKVETESLSNGSASKIHSRNKENEEDCSYHIIVGSFSIHSNAVNYSKVMESKGYPSQIIETSKGVTYVSVQCFSSRDKASANLNSVYETVDVKGWVLKR